MGDGGITIIRGFMVDSQQAGRLPAGMLTGSGEWWLGPRPGDRAGREYVAHNGTIRLMEQECECGVRPALLVGGVEPDPRKNRKLTVRMPGTGDLRFTFAGMSGEGAVYLCDRVLESAPYGRAEEASERLGAATRSCPCVLGPDPDVQCLPPLARDDLDFDGYADGDDRVCTDVSLSDYDWMSYTMSARFRTRKHGEIKAVWEYCGGTSSDVYVRQLGDDVERDYRLAVSSDLVLRAFSAFMRAWADANDPAKECEYAFNGGAEALALWNETVGLCTVEQYAETDRNLPPRLTWLISRDELRMLDDRFAGREPEEGLPKR